MFQELNNFILSEVTCLFVVKSLNKNIPNVMTVGNTTVCMTVAVGAKKCFHTARENSVVLLAGRISVLHDY
jgi:hypothetical protein